MKQLLVSFILLFFVMVAKLAFAQERPNVIIIMTDDQGIGDFGCMGNPLVQTPNIDAMFERCVHFSNFYVSPVCAPTRACLLTGRYNYRTRVVDTYMGRAMMDTAEITLAERLKAAGYATGIFGKWHLGDCYPMRAMDQGFDTAVVHRGGGIGQPSDPPGGEGAYTNPILFHNGKPKRENGYCTDVYYGYAIDFIRNCEARNQQFFVYLPDNCPHGPFQDVPVDWWKKYKNAQLTQNKYPVIDGGNPVSDKTNPDMNARVFAMISNVDENIGRLQDELIRLNLVENTIVVFLTDNGPNGSRYVQGLRGQKTSVYEGGIKTLCLLQWPAKFKTQKTIKQLAAHIDLVPTLLDACNIAVPADDPKLDGISLMPLLEDKPIDWEKIRPPYFVQVHRGNQPQRYHHFAVRDHRWKLVNHSGFHLEQFKGKPKFELYDLDNDPFEKADLAAENPDLVKTMVAQYDQWFDDVSHTRENNYECPPIVIDPEKENPLVLTRQDVRRVDGESGWGRAIRWILTSERERSVQVTCRFNQELQGPIILEVGQRKYTTDFDAEATQIKFPEVLLGPGPFDLRATAKNAKGEIVSAHQIEISSPAGNAN